MSSKIFNQNRSARVKTSPFDLSHERKLSGNMGELIPVLLQEVVPGDKFNIDTQSMIRFAPMVAPVMHRINAYIHYFFVPNRILWEGWEKFITGDTPSTVPSFRIADCSEGTGVISISRLGDHMGIPTGTFAATGQAVSQLPFRAYFQIWNDYYRDENLQDEIDIENLTAEVLNFPLLKRAWEKDYFTSALPWAQKGNPVTMDAKINYRDAADLTYGALPGTPADTNQALTTTNADIDGSVHMDDGTHSLRVDNIDSVEIEVEELRRATRLQRWLERNARSGSRYVEHLLAHWGIRSSDQRLQRAEYIGGGKSPVVISEVLNTTGTAELPQGNMAGHGINVGRTNKAYKFCEEHGWIIGIMSVIPEPTYQQGLHKMFQRQLNLDFYYPEFAQLGEQEILQKELFFNGSDITNDNYTFGYQSRFAEYKYQPSTVHGQFKNQLDFWHLGRKFGSMPNLNAEFIECNPDLRIFAVTDPTVEHMYIQLYHRITAIRPMPFFNDPTL